MRSDRDFNRSESRVLIKDFPGYVPNVDPHDPDAGTAVRQVNAMSPRPGELRVRLGYAVVRFDDPVN